MLGPTGRKTAPVDGTYSVAVRTGMERRQAMIVTMLMVTAAGTAGPLSEGIGLTTTEGRPDAVEDH